jgi:hypothetical protein
MQENDSNQNRSVGASTKTWQDVAKQIIDEPDSDKLNSLVEELCDILDKTRKGPVSVHTLEHAPRAHRTILP